MLNPSNAGLLRVDSASEALLPLVAHHHKPEPTTSEL